VIEIHPFGTSVRNTPVRQLSIYPPAPEYRSCNACRSPGVSEEISESSTTTLPSCLSRVGVLPQVVWQMRRLPSVTLFAPFRAMPGNTNSLFRYIG
jgi:hypothetical protein